MTTFIYKSKQEVTPKSARIPFVPTHIVTRKDGSTFEVNTTPEFLAKWQERLGWTAREVKQS